MTPEDLAKIEADQRRKSDWNLADFAEYASHIPALIAALKEAWAENERLTTIAESAVAHLAEYEKWRSTDEETKEYTFGNVRLGDIR